ncbi:MAG: hypothetical protein ABSG60_10660 [Terracidiphilus sp.]|jgi:hypothetical protein
MPSRGSSLLAGRNNAPLTPEQISRTTNTFLGFDSSVNTRYDPNAHTAFRVSTDENGDEFGEIVFGPDIYPGTSLVDPNSALSMNAASAHELTHYHRWVNLLSLNDDHLEHLDEAFTSLQAISRYHTKLNDIDVRQLAADAMLRIQLFIKDVLPEIDGKR